MRKFLTARLLLDTAVIGGAMLGSLLIASALDPMYAVIGYILMLLSAIGSIIILRATNGAKSLLLINWYFSVVNIIGIIQYSMKGW